jgi:hypothetical protein
MIPLTDRTGFLPFFLRACHREGQQGDAMTVRYAVRNEGAEHATAIRRLARAREEEARLGGLSAAARRTRAGPLAQHRLSEGRAYVASREQWLHWIETGESLAPWADGEWGPQIGTAPGVLQAGGVGRDLRSIHDRASRSQVELAQAVSRSAKRVKALERVTEVAAARRKRTQAAAVQSRRWPPRGSDTS